jgi:hypothetical protein
LTQLVYGLKRLNRPFQEPEEGQMRVLRAQRVFQTRKKLFNGRNAKAGKHLLFSNSKCAESDEQTTTAHFFQYSFFNLEDKIKPYNHCWKIDRICGD